MTTGKPFSVTGDYSAAQTNTELVAAPATDQRIVITSVFANTAGAGTFKLLNGSGGAVKWGTVSLPNTSSANATFDPGISLTKKTALCLTTNYAGAHCITVTGYIVGRNALVN